MADDDLRAAELEFLQARQNELDDELRRQQRIVGEALTEESAVRFHNNVLEELRRSGKGLLAIKYDAAFQDFRTAMRTVQELHQRGQTDPEATESMNDRQEMFERVGAEVNAWFESLGKR